PPVVVDAGERILFDCFNSSKQPTPPFTVAFLNNTGGELSSKTIDSLPPGYSDGHLYSPPQGTLVSVLVTFASPPSGQRCGVQVRPEPVVQPKTEPRMACPAEN